MKKIYFLGLSFCYVLKAFSQDQNIPNPQQSALLTVNPSFAGSNGSVRDQLTYYNQWPNASINPITYYNSVDAYVKKLHGGIAISGSLNDQYHGAWRTSQLNFIYAPIFECKKDGLKIIPSLQLGYIRQNLDFGQLNFDSGFNWLPTETPTSKKNVFDGSAGLLINYKNLYFGGSAFHLNQPDIGVLGSNILLRRLSLNASYNFPINKNTLLNLSGLYSQQQGYNTFQVAANAVLFRYVTAGIGFAREDDYFASLGFRNNHFSVSAGYQKSFNNLLTSTYSSSWRVSMAISFSKKQSEQTQVAFEKW